jgi:hypothetical protein
MATILIKIQTMPDSGQTRGENRMQQSQSARVKALLWLLAAIVASCATYFHFVYGSFVWALTDIPFVLLLFYASFRVIRDVQGSTEPSLDDSKGEKKH